MNRWLIILVFLESPCLAWCQDRPADEPALIEQFDGKVIRGWEIDGEYKIEDGAVKIGGKSPTRMHLTEPLGGEFTLLLEYQYRGPGSFALQFEKGRPPDQNFFYDMPDWTELIVTGKRGKLGFGQLINYTLRYRTGSGSSGLNPGASGSRTIEFIVPAEAGLTIRRLALKTTPPGESPGPA